MDRSVIKSMKHIIAVCTSAVIFCSSSYSQKQTQHVQQVWLGYFNQTRVSERWGIWTDLHLRTREEFVSNLSTAIARFGLTYYANDHLKFTAGYAYINYFPADNHPSVSQTEHRPWQQVQWNTNAKRSRLMQWIRVEERYRRKIVNEQLAEGYTFNFRTRYNLALTLPLGKHAFAPNTLSLAFNNEVHVNMGKQIVNNYFDQNRLFGGLIYHLNPHAQLQAGYMNVFQQLPGACVVTSYMQIISSQCCAYKSYLRHKRPGASVRATGHPDHDLFILQPVCLQQGFDL